MNTDAAGKRVTKSVERILANRNREIRVVESIGRDIAFAKEQFFANEDYVRWLESELGMTPQEARRYIKEALT